MFTEFEKGTKPVRSKPLLSSTPSHSEENQVPVLVLGLWSGHAGVCGETFGSNLNVSAV